MEWSAIIATSSLLAAPLTLVIAIMELGVKNNAVDPEQSTVIISAGIAASLLFPSIARRLLRQQAEEAAANAPKTAHH